MLETLGIIIGVILGVIAIAIIILLIVPYDDMDTYFRKFPDDINTNRGHYPYKRMLMKFEKWRQLFELDPTKFDFVRLNGTRASTNYMDYPFHKTHPVFFDADEEIFYLVDFRYPCYVRYFYYERRINDRISFLSEEKMTKAIVGDVQSKIDALVEESEKRIKDTLKLQEKIVLRMSGEDKEESK